VSLSWFAAGVRRFRGFSSCSGRIKNASVRGNERLGELRRGQPPNLRWRTIKPVLRVPWLPLVNPALVWQGGVNRPASTCVPMPGRTELTRRSSHRLISLPSCDTTAAVIRLPWFARRGEYDSGGNPRGHGSLAYSRREGPAFGGLRAGPAGGVTTRHRASLVVPEFHPGTCSFAVDKFPIARYHESPPPGGHRRMAGGHNIRVHQSRGRRGI